MAKKSLDKLAGDIEKAGNRVRIKVTQVKTMKTIINRLLRRLKLRWQKGKGTNSSGNEVSFKELAESTKAQRRGDVAFFTDKNGRVRKYKPEKPPVLSPLTKPDKSNMIETGKTFKGTKAVAKKGFAGIKIGRDKHSQKAIDYNDDTRPIFNVNKKDEKEVVQKEVDKAIKGVLDKLFK